VAVLAGGDGSRAGVVALRSRCGWRSARAACGGRSRVVGPV